MPGARYADAQEKSREALRINTKVAVLLYHAGMIENALGNRGEATLLLQAAATLNPSFDLTQIRLAHATLAQVRADQ